ncbi:hypothetical protein Tco_1378035 [Tanacetum coccineum]
MNISFFSSVQCCLIMFSSIEHDLEVTEATHATQKTLLKQQYENFNASSTKSLDSIFNRLQKLVSRLAILGVVITQEDLNSKFLRSCRLESGDSFSTVSSNVNTASPQTSSASLSDNAVYTFMVENPNGSNLLHLGNLRKFYEMILEEWVDVDLSLECRSPRNKDSQFRYQDNTRKQGNNEDTSSKVMLAIDGVGFD